LESPKSIDNISISATIGLNFGLQGMISCIWITSRIHLFISASLKPIFFAQ
jgi:hypothetical protein